MATQTEYSRETMVKAVILAKRGIRPGVIAKRLGVASTKTGGHPDARTH